MPTYEFECPVCGEKFEERLSMLDLESQPCPECGELSPVVITNTQRPIVEGGTPTHHGRGD